MGPEQEVGIEILHLPTHPSSEPLWTLASASALGILYLASAPTAAGARALEALRRRIEEDGQLRSFHAVLERGPQGPSMPALAAELGLRAEAALFRLPAGASPSARLPLAQLLASLVP
jgi:hypothetical protein